MIGTVAQSHAIFKDQTVNIQGLQIGYVNMVSVFVWIDCMHASFSVQKM